MKQIKLVLLVVIAFALGALAPSLYDNDTQVDERIAFVESRLDALEESSKKLERKLKEKQFSRTRLNNPIKDQDKVKAIEKVVFSPDGSHQGDPFLGPDDKQLIVMSFGDFQCLPCRKFYKETFSKLKEEFIETQKVTFIYRDFPLRSKEYSVRAAMVAHCAGEQGAYWPMFQLLYENEDLVDKGRFDEISSMLGDINLEKLRQCVNSDRYVKELAQDVNEGIKLGAKGAPGFFIGRKIDDTYDGVFVRGAQPYPVIRNEIVKLMK